VLTVENIEKIKLFAKVCGKAIFEKIPITPFLDKALLKTILRRKVELEDFLMIDEKVKKKI
jgi:HECT-domain (ubiquitin-transferase)